MRICGIDGHLPGYNTVQEHAKDVPVKYLDHLIRLASDKIMGCREEKRGGSATLPVTPLACR